MAEMERTRDVDVIKWRVTINEDDRMLLQLALAAQVTALEQRIHRWHREHAVFSVAEWRRTIALSLRSQLLLEDLIPQDESEDENER
jgi:hypothetical protein